MKSKLFHGRQKMADLIAQNHNLILFMPRFGIPLGFKDKRVDEVCSENGISTELFLLVCNVCTYDDYLPTIDEIASARLAGLVAFLKASHTYYLEKIPHIGDHLKRIADQMEERYGAILYKFYADYQSELKEHFVYEESVVFPYLEELRAGSRRRENLLHLNDKHEGIEETLGDLTQIVYKYLPGNLMPEESIDVVFDILQLSSDFQKHYLIEEKIVMPYIHWLEGRNS
ncbi:MAG: hemerythrin domain-containing protein [Bacteroidales bacterium]|nr:hemerythrin domain-containing protein [Bacteroidales bacterium]